MSLAFPFKASLRQHMMVAADSKSDAAVLLVGNPCVFNGMEIQVNNIVQRTNCCFHRALHVIFVLNGKMSQRQACQIADHELTRMCRCNNDCIVVFDTHLGGHMLNRRHILCNLCAEIGAVNYSHMSVGVHFVDSVPVEGKRRSGLNCRAQHQSDDILDSNGALCDARIVDAVCVALFPFLTEGVLQRIALDGQNFVWTHQMPL